jgi:hypothetical protein
LKYFNSYLRHRFDVTKNGLPIPATGIRIKVPNNQTDIDEIEVNGNLAIEQQVVRITNGLGFTISWDGNNGEFNDPAAGAAPPANRALASQGTIPFTSSDLGPILDPNFPFHRAINLNDGFYGNSHSWISANGIGGNSDPDPFAGLNFGGTVVITNIAWSRDNGDTSSGEACGGTCTDRTIGTYRLQYTSVAAPDATTPDTGDASTGWSDLGTITYASEAPPSFNTFLRHRFDLASAGGPISATGIRIKVPNGSIDIDEIEINASTSAPPPPAPLGITPALGYEIAWDGNDGHFATFVAPPANNALATQGTTPFTSSDLGPSLGIDFHRAVNLNDGLYGNSHSWISANGLGGTSDPDPFAGLNFNTLISITNIAWSRDNGAGTSQDRALGTYTVQVTAVPSPDASTVETEDTATGWATVGRIDYRQANAPLFSPWLRHRFDLSSGGAAIDATGVRIKVSNGSMDIDEIEVNTAAVRPLPHLTTSRSGGNVIISWSGGGGLEGAPSVKGPWACIPAATSPYTTGAGSFQFYRVRR